ncbi:hypothetical protein E4U47_000755 [Claviceps purpurea]|nr:hypothetical protein E4U47_000755 [Claviceps purpurea]
MALAASHTALASIISSWEFTGNPSGGLRDVTFPFKIDGTVHKSDYFFSQQLRFQGVTGLTICGIGNQPNGPGGESIVRAQFISDYQLGTTTQDSNCRLVSGVPSDDTITCTVDFSGSYGAMYNIVVEQVKGTTWKATVVDTSNGKSVHIGSWTLPSTAGGIRPNELGYVRYYGPMGPGMCSPPLPRAEVIIYDPFSRTLGAGTGHINEPFNFLYPCEGGIGYSAQNIGNGYHIRFGS